MALGQIKEGVCPRCGSQMYLTITNEWRCPACGYREQMRLNY